MDNVEAKQKAKDLLDILIKNKDSDIEKLLKAKEFLKAIGYGFNRTIEHALKPLLQPTKQARIYAGLFGDDGPETGTGSTP